MKLSKPGAVKGELWRFLAKLFGSILEAMLSISMMMIQKQLILPISFENKPSKKQRQSAPIIAMIAHIVKLEGKCEE